MAISFSDDPSALRADQLEGFFVGWPAAPSPAKHREILQRSFAVWLAFDDDRCVGFVNALSDGVFSAYIPLLEVLPSYQGRGLGAALVTRMRETLRDAYAIDLVCDESVAPFYDKLSFHRLVGFGVRNYERQRGE